jgi:hypothetical protein
MTRLIHIAALLLACSLVSPAVAAELTPHQAEYKVKISVVSGRLNTELRASDDGYVATHAVRPTGLSKVIANGKMHVSSTFTTSDNGVRPVSYRAIDTIRDEPEANIEFDWSTNQARGTVGTSPVEFQLDGLSHDAVSIQYELMHALLNGQPDATYTMFDVDKMRVVNVRDVGAKSVRTPAGTYDVVGIEHQREGSSRITTMWCAPELGYLPVLIERHRKGKLIFRATLRRYTEI